jgi:hypothetical protein
MLVAIVVPWPIKSIDTGSDLLRSGIARSLFTVPCVGSYGVVGTFADQTSPVCESSNATSVKVPPTSIPMRRIRHSNVKTRALVKRFTCSSTLYWLSMLRPSGMSDGV